MNFRKRLILLFISLTVFLCFTVAYGTLLRTLHDLRKTKIINRITHYVKNENIKLEEGELRIISKVVYEVSRHHGLDYRLVLALMKVESNFQHNAISPMGARGLLQVKPHHASLLAQEIGIDWKGAKTLDEPDKNIKIGVYFLSKLQKEFNGMDMVLNAYNMGPTRLKEILSKKRLPKNYFSQLVLNEYHTNKRSLPDPKL